MNDHESHGRAKMEIPYREGYRVAYLTVHQGEKFEMGVPVKVMGLEKMCAGKDRDGRDVHENVNVYVLICQQEVPGQKGICDSVLAERAVPFILSYRERKEQYRETEKQNRRKTKWMIREQPASPRQLA